MKKIVLISFLSFFVCLGGCNMATSQELQNEAHFKSHACIPGYGHKKKQNAALFQGNKKKKKYFEGWYFKMVAPDGASILSVIPGISLSENGEDQHAFIQIIDGKTAETFYYSFPIEDFAFSKEKFAVRIGKNYFSEDSLILDIQNDTTSISGKIYITDQTYLTNHKKKKVGIMGWYRSVPFMQCYHGVVSLNHTLAGSLTMNNQTYKFDDGLGYIEKDWGQSMPSSWIWMQSNNFSAEKTSFMLSVATIPWMGSSFTGFLGFFLNDTIIERFGTYTRAKLAMKSSNSDTIKLVISDKKYTYHIETYHHKSGLLKAPVKGSMDRRIAESIDAKIKLTVTDKQARVIFEDSTSIAGLELVGDLKKLTRSDKKRTTE